MNLSNEDVLKIFIAKNKFFLEKLIKETILNIGCEKYQFNRKIDVFATTLSGINVYVELQLNKSDVTHYNQIKQIIENINDEKCIILWFATDFDRGYLELVKSLAKLQSIKFLAITIDNNILNCIDEIGNYPYFEVVEKTQLLNNYIDNFNIYYIFDNIDREIYKKNTVCNESSGTSLEKNNSLSSYILEKIMEKTREQLHYIPSVYNFKKIQNNKVVYGLGKSAVRLEIGYNSWFKRIYIEFRFNENFDKNIYKKFKAKESLIKNEFGEEINFDDSLKKIRIEKRYNFSDDPINEIIEKADIFIKKYIASLCFCD